MKRDAITLPSPGGLQATRGALSATFLEEAMQCPLRALWQGQNKPLMPLHPSAYVGTVSHRLQQWSRQHRFQSPERAAAVWEELLAEEEKKLEANWLTCSLVPLERTTSQFAERRLKAIALAAEVAGPPPERTGGVYGAEKELAVEHDGVTIKGYPDWMGKVDGRSVIRDDKSGRVMDRNGDILSRIRDQLHIYAWLFKEKNGGWPNRLEVRSYSRAAPVEVPLDTAHAEMLIADGIAIVQQMDEAIAAEQPAVLAKPSTTGCRYCSFRPACPAWREHQELHESFRDGPKDIWLRVLAREDKNNRVQLRAERLCDRKPVDFILGAGDRHPALAYCTAGTEIACFNLRQLRRRPEFFDDNLTTIYLMQNSEDDHAG